MADKNLILVLNSRQEYVRYSGEDEKKYAAQINRLFKSISDLYIPLIDCFERLESEKIPFKIALVITPILCSLLEDRMIQAQYIQWLDKRIELGKKELERCKDNPDIVKAVTLCFEKASDDKIRFLRYGQKILKKILEYHNKGYVELLATCGTEIFFPHYRGMEEIMGAQVETGIYAFRRAFGDVPDGFWLPEMGFCRGVEKILSLYGINYTILDARTFLFSENPVEKGIFCPARLNNILAAFGNDPEFHAELFEPDGFACNPVYKNQNLDIGFELSAEYFPDFFDSGSPRYELGYKYRNKKGGAASDSIYDYDAAKKQCALDAEEFIRRKSDKLAAAEKLLPEEKNISLVFTLDSSLLLSEWTEGVLWIENIFRAAAKTNEIKFEHCKNLLQNQFELQKIFPYFGSSDGQGYGEDFLSGKNNWMLRYVRKASERMVDLANRFPSDTGLKVRLLNAGAKELMLAQSCIFSLMINNDDSPDYARSYFNRCINDFTEVFDALGSNTVSTEWLTKLESVHRFFPWMNYRIFSTKR